MEKGARKNNEDELKTKFIYIKRESNMKNLLIGKKNWKMNSLVALLLENNISDKKIISIVAAFYNKSIAETKERLNQILEVY